MDMKTTIYDLLPEQLSDESAYDLVTFFTNLATELESHYFAQMHHYLKSNRPANLPDLFKEQFDDEAPS